MGLAIARAVGDWASLEHDLARLLNELIGGASGLGVALYYAPNSTETRLALIDVAFGHGGGHLGVFSPQLKGCWKCLLRRVKKAKSSRNTIAHGHTILYNDKAIRLVSNLNLDLSNTRDQLPGHSRHDVERMCETFQELYSATRELSDCLRTSKQESVDVVSSFLKLLALADRLAMNKEDRKAHFLEMQSPSPA